MFRRILLHISLAVLASTVISGSSRADNDPPELIVTPKVTLPGPQEPYTVLTMAPDGSWGVTTSKHIGEAITGAITHCEAMSGRKLGCGSMMKSIQSGWIFGVRCGGTNILAAAKLRADAELAALNRETELRQVYRQDSPPCGGVVEVDPNGFAVGSASPTQ